MKKLLFLLPVILFSCHDFINTIHGNGNTVKETRQVNVPDRVEVSGDIDVVVRQGGQAGVVVEADANLVPYIITRTENGKLVIGVKEHYSLESNKHILVSVTTNDLRELSVTGSGNVNSEGVLSHNGKMDISVTGSGDMSLQLNAPSVDADITGSGNIKISGETKDMKVGISGSGDFTSEELKAENVNVAINGSGTARVFADMKLNVEVNGSGDVFYKGNASVNQSVHGSGSVSKS
ncbi:MAG: hypothetical protein JWN76_1140 [Chitinophagaceae bacterium]|nr:hypothetical protein [Chitinophagaceae bacterium]